MAAKTATYEDIRNKYQPEIEKAKIEIVIVHSWKSKTYNNYDNLFLLKIVPNHLKY